MVAILKVVWSFCLLGAAFGEVTPHPKVEVAPYLRGTQPLSHLKMDPKGRHVAYTGEDHLGLWVIDLKSKGIFQISKAQVGGAFFWSPDGYRVFYRELIKTSPQDPIRSVVSAFDVALGRSVKLDDMPFPTGFLTFDPRDLRFAWLSPKGIRTKRIYLPNERLARWQVAQRLEKGKWLVTQGGVLWTSQGGLAMRRLADDNSGVESFDLSPDGEWVAWATEGGKVYVSKGGDTPTLIGHGRDPSWHPDKPLLVYAGARMVGQTPINYDVRVADARGGGKFLTATQFSNERWPRWHPSGGQIVYTMAHTTDLFLMDFAP